MNNNGWNIWKILGILLLCYLGYHAVMWATALVLKVAIPVLIIGGVVYVVYRASGGKALMGGGRRSLP